MCTVTEQLLAYTLPSLQKQAFSQLGCGPSDTLSILTTLYERGLISYPRTDCGYLPTVLYKPSRKLVKALGSTIGAESREQCFSVDYRHQGSVWDDSKVIAHHGIIPLKQSALRLHGLTATHMAVYFMVVDRFLRLFSK